MACVLYPGQHCRAHAGAGDLFGLDNAGDAQSLQQAVYDQAVALRKAATQQATKPAATALRVSVHAATKKSQKESLKPVEQVELPQRAKDEHVEEEHAHPMRMTDLVNAVEEQQHSNKEGFEGSGTAKEQQTASTQRTTSAASHVSQVRQLNCCQKI